ncbi:UNVERIFIED_CONTAM: hypothetical protein RMT77_008863 [Armadillidium vulgare]
MANKVLNETETKTENSRIVNPKFRRHQQEELVNAGLSCFITKGTMNFFELFHINADFLREPPISWPENILIKEGLGIVKSLKVVNDVTERGVKLISDFNNLLTQDEEQKQYVLQVVHKCRMLYPNLYNRLFIILSFLKIASDVMSLSFLIKIH